ncbi:MAG: hypothetical protein KAS32_29275 [Candidatus Peribacteraceae bacterium]|nr:hypothetical protein [Candidatus Peribacteraceae bacterium]
MGVDKKVIKPEDISIRPDRLDMMTELVYLEEWLKLNNPDRAVNYGIPTLNFILTPVSKQAMTMFHEPTVTPSKRDMEVAAAVIQWLGTNCGMSFIQSAERRIEEERQKENDVEELIHKLENINKEGGLPQHA